METLTPDHVHDYSKENITAEPTCTEKGTVELVCICGHTKYEKTDMLEHEYTTANIIEAPTCTKYGKVKLICDYGRIRYVSVAPLQHNYSVTSTEEPTCKKSGQINYECECGEKKQEILEKIPHDFDKWKITAEASCTDVGQKSRTCSKCSETDTMEIPALLHNFSDKKCIDCDAE